MTIPPSPKMIKVVLNSTNVISNSSGFMTFHVSLPLMLEKYNVLRVDSVCMNEAFRTQVASNSFYNIHLKSLTQFDTYNTVTRGLNDIVFTGSGNSIQYDHHNSSHGIPIMDTSFLQQRTWTLAWSNGKQEILNPTINADNIFQVTFTLIKYE